MIVLSKYNRTGVLEENGLLWLLDSGAQWKIKDVLTGMSDHSEIKKMEVDEVALTDPRADPSTEPRNNNIVPPPQYHTFTYSIICAY